MTYSPTTLQPYYLAAHPVHNMVMDTCTLQICLLSNDSVRLGDFTMHGVTVWVCMPVVAHKQPGSKSMEGWSQERHKGRHGLQDKDTS